MQQQHDEIRAIVQRIHDAWSQGRPEDLHQYFDDRMVIRGPEFLVMGRGRDACVQSYAGFLKVATVHEYDRGEPEIDLHGDTAVAVYSWKMTYSLESGRYTEKGHDLFVFSRASGEWRAIWRTMLVA
jgi:ketosteroid isomerase-like protein